MTLKDSWLEFVDKQAISPAYYMSGVQKIRADARWQVPGDIFFDDSIDLQTFGYSEKGNKLKTLKRHYFNRERVINAKKIIRIKYNQKSYGSAQFPLTGQEKTWTKQDFCMSSCVVTYYPRGGLRVVIFYRTTEIIKKFGADLIFLREVVLPRFNRIKSIDNVSFVFSNLTVHPMFFTTLLAHHPSPILFLSRIKNSDSHFHKGIERWMKKYLFEGDTSWIQKFSQAKQTHAAMKRLMTEETQQKLKQYFIEGN